MTHSEQMLIALETGNLDLANDLFQKALIEDDTDTLLDLAIYLESIGFFPQAKQIYLQFNQEYPELNLSLAQIASEDGDWEEAYLYLERIPRDHPSYVNALVIMADLYDAEGLTDVAREKLIEAHTLSTDPLITFALAEINMSLEAYQEAITLYASLDNRDILDKTDISTYERIGKAYASLGYFETAISFLEKAIDIAYDEQTIYELATLLYEQDDYQKANLYYKQLATISPDFEGYHVAYATSLKAEHRLKEAYLIAQEGISKNPFDAALLLLASQLAYENHDITQSEHYLLQAKGIADDHELMTLRLSNLYLEQERFEELIALEDDTVENPLTRWHIAKAHHHLDHFKKASTIYQDLEQDLKTNPDFLKEYAYFLREFGQRNKAQQIATLYLKLVPDDFHIADWLENDRLD